MRVVVIDDSRLSVSALQNIIARVGHEVVGTAFDGENGIQVCKQLKPEVVCLDFVMPGLDGLETAKELRKAVAGVRIIMITQNPLTPSVMNDINPVTSILKPITESKIREAFSSL